MLYAFVFFTALHGLIHLPGFLKAFELGQFSQLTKFISKKTGVFWLLATLLFLLVALLIFFEVGCWPIPALISILISQTLIITSWRDAKFGTIANGIILILALPAMGNYFFDRMTGQEIESLIATTESADTTVVTESDLIGLPPVVKNWLQHSGVVGHQKVRLVHLKQFGEMRTATEGNWLPFTAEQFFNPVQPSFIWKVTMQIMPGLYMIGRDKFINGEGEMHIKLLSLFNVVKEGNNEKINSGSAQRYLSELCWFPSGALNKSIQWEQISSSKAKAVFDYKNIHVDGVFEFNENFEIISFTTNRYYGGSKDAVLEKWHIQNHDFKKINNIVVPVKSSVTWKLKEGDFTWLHLQISELNYNQ